MGQVGLVLSPRSRLRFFHRAYEWTTLTDAERTTIKSQYAAAGIKLIVSVFGATDVPTTSRADPIATANKFADWVIQYKLDGIDVDYEVGQPLVREFLISQYPPRISEPLISTSEQKSVASFSAWMWLTLFETWLISFTRQLRVKLPQPNYILSHARKSLFKSGLDQPFNVLLSCCSLVGSRTLRPKSS